MPRSPVPSRGLALPPRRRTARSLLPRTASLAALLSLAAVFGLSRWNGAHTVSVGVSSEGATAPAKTAAAVAAPESSDRLLDPVPLLGAEASKFWPGVPAQPRSRSAFAPPSGGIDGTTPTEQERARASASASQTREVAEGAPLPMPRPAELWGSEAPDAPRMANPRRVKTAAVPASPVDNRSFFEKLFGLQSSPGPGPALAYAAPDSGALGLSPGTRLSPAAPSGAEPGTAVYDISARLVYMPNGERLEAHSGLRDKLDDPRFVHVRMHGATPPGTYDLTERERLFHGVRALRLNPVGGSAAVHGRAGLLAHTFMLGPNGDSNGCVSFRDYNKFLQAYLRGEVRRLVVVAGRGQGGWPANADKRIGMGGRGDVRDRDV
jgi:hypothetical protein